MDSEHREAGVGLCCAPAELPASCLTCPRRRAIEPRDQAARAFDARLGPVPVSPDDGVENLDAIARTFGPCSIHRSVTRHIDDGRVVAP
jgi:hypothetical protein